MAAHGSFRAAFSPRSKPYSNQQSVPSDLIQNALNHERWRTYFQRAQKNVSSSAAASRIVSFSSPPMRNFLDVLGTRLFFWDQERNAVVLTNIQDAELDRVTILECDIPPLFEVSSIAVSPEGSSVALIGQKGVSILDIGSEDLVPESGRKISRCIAISERYFLNNPKITVVQCEWFPHRENQIVLLTSDNNLRFYRISSPTQPSLVVGLHGSSAKRSLHSFSAFTLAQSIVNTANSPQKGGSSAAVYALKSDGSIWTFDVAVESSRTIASSLRGPLSASAPFATDMTQMATSIVFIDAALPVLLIATNKQRILHGILIEKDDIEVDSEIHASGVIPAKFEFLEIERLELSPAAGELGKITRPTKSAKLFLSPATPFGYLLVTENQLVGVKLPWLNDLDLLVSDNLDLSSIRPATVQTVTSLDPLADVASIGFIGSRLISTDNGDCSVLSVASNGQVTLQKFIRSQDVQGPSASLQSPVTFSESGYLKRRQKPSNEAPFDEYIESLLRRDRSLPAFTFGSSDQITGDDLIHVAGQFVQQFQESYVVKQKQAYNEIQNRKARNALRKVELLELLDKLEQNLAELSTQFNQYSSQAEEVDLDVLETHSRIDNLQVEFSHFNPVLSDAEQKLRENVEEMEIRTSTMEDLTETLANKMAYRERVIRQQMEASGDASVLTRSTTSNTASIQLASEIRRLDDLKRRVKDVADRLQPR